MVISSEFSVLLRGCLYTIRISIHMMDWGKTSV